jgi:hypothetical protein
MYIILNSFSRHPFPLFSGLAPLEWGNVPQTWSSGENVVDERLNYEHHGNLLLRPDDVI